MTWHAIVRPQVSRAVGQCGLSRNGLIRLFARLHMELPVLADRLRLLRDSTDPDTFIYPVGQRDRGSDHYCEFRVNDAIAGGFLFVEDLRHWVR